MTGKVAAGDRRVLFTKWVGTAWQETSRRLKDTAIRSFVECGISLPISGSRDIEINMDGLPDYRMGKSADISQCHLIRRSVHVNRRKLYRVFNFNLKKRSCC